ncbi:endogenous retrovirus group K member 9 Gag polyprotein-like [Vidua macroura]|uniref:endogenous retrovirus group K member 9 Gag polyprotein-like n=1 Tax=Vidua macroura TaxID=187451 RepID=UPI0023A86A5B|nr:endogenous retrovirus group K member 9 Gag polyprotein-like [Vidua macroura]XP_053859629.1 endogenous retrovirus group K member 9 Gag polyprotein-like [Vidua macroura]XP_053859630.1 endogenous retrovirus group K member 9 Gag polyprotein-like [Vidua macroura]XP_053859631.1 endogenous retrovirus group K member 9 Gag polyprotein-like [Vidua macroura]XP_053859632.1 endogenous retrovirus group K member 9 Gag polyprotein-like [Vidua macroura]XP_053859633.1 endogenous retrovirus group K member 9 G
MEPTGQYMAGAATLPGGPQAFPVLRGVTHNTHQPLSFKIANEVPDTVAWHGVGSAEVMQTLVMLVAELLTPSDIHYLAHALFDPVQFDVFETKWAWLAASTVQQNATLGPQDPRRVVSTDMLMGTGNYTDPQGQARYDPLMLDQCQTLGMAAMFQTLEMVAPLEPFATIVQGVEEPFMKFAGRLTASVERQSADPETRGVVTVNLARSNSNTDCKRVIKALPGEPTVSQMAEACANLSPSVQKMAAWATVVQPVWAVLQGWQQQQWNAWASAKREESAEGQTSHVLVWPVWKAKPYDKCLQGNCSC